MVTPSLSVSGPGASPAPSVWTLPEPTQSRSVPSSANANLVTVLSDAGSLLHSVISLELAGSLRQSILTFQSFP